ncbi:MAG: zinc-ribbon domain-containing protein, partial [Desulfobacterales bacterium]|nr:zinc-ribbon domain-containing protein [Desulfobacterales bacterium]
MVEITCPQCNYTKSIPPEKIPPGVRWIRCPKCGNRFEYLKKQEDVRTERRHATPWERRLELGLWRGIKQ